MRNPFGFFVELLRQPIAVVAWVFVLMVVNMASLAFWDEPVARIVFYTFAASAMWMMALYSKFGFERILGLGHVLWAPLIVYLLTQLSTVSGSLETYLLVLMAVNAVSLAFDARDVWMFTRGDRG